MIFSSPKPKTQRTDSVRGAAAASGPTPPPLTRQRRGGAAENRARWIPKEDDQVELKNQQSGIWVRGTVVSAGNLEDHTGGRPYSWSKSAAFGRAAGTGTAFETVKVENDANQELFWDDECTSSLPSCLWGAVHYLRGWNPDRIATGAHSQAVSTNEEVRLALQAVLKLRVAQAAQDGSPVDVSALSNFADLIAATMRSHDFHADVTLLGGVEDCRGVGGVALALMDIAARAAAADAGLHALVCQEMRRAETATGKTTAASAEAVFATPTQSAVARLRLLPPLLRLFMWRFVKLHYVPPELRSQHQHGLQSLRPKSNDKLAQRLEPAFAALFGACGGVRSTTAPLRELSTFHRWVSALLMLRGGGVPTAVLKELSAHNCAAHIGQAYDDVDQVRLSPCGLPA